MLPHDRRPPVGARNPAILYGLGNLLENAVDFARERVEVTADWTEDEIAVEISDDGPGFAPEIMDRIGEPYVRSRRRRRMYASDDDRPGPRLLHRQDAAGALRRNTDLREPHLPERGAVVTVRWGRSDFERSPQSPELEPSAANA